MLFTSYLPLLIFAFKDHSHVKSDNQRKPLSLSYSEPNIYQFQLKPGRYRVTCYGAQGGMSNSGIQGGRGAFASGFFNVKQPIQTFYAFVGGQGIRSTYGSAPGGFNGGGISGYCKEYHHHLKKKHKPFGPGSGGGATDLRINDDKIANRIIVAAGGSGSSHSGEGAPGGDLNGYSGYGPSSRTNQNSGDVNGRGADGGMARRYPSSGGGGGYKGGSNGVSSDSYSPAVISDSGSSYISGYPGCIPHPSMLLESGEMYPGVNLGHGKIQIEEIYTCSQNCLDCASSLQCKKCEQSYRLFEGFCYSTCPPGTLDRTTYCERCDSSCLSCSEIATNCTNCHANDYHYKEQCLQKCPAGTVEFGTECKDICPIGTYAKEGICQECNLPCLECFGHASNCTECSENRFLFINKCLDKCPERTVINGNKCLSECEPGQYLYHDFCYTKCPKGTYSKGFICEKCHSSCSECINDADTCIECDENKFLYNSHCLNKCPDNFISYNNKCTVSCPNTAYLNGKECVDVCPKGKYGINKVCKDCDSSCESCLNSSTFCTKCNKGTYLYQNQCVHECVNGSYIYENECVRDCPPGFQPNDNICQEEIEYYAAEIREREPILSNTVTIVIISILVVVCFVLCFILCKVSMI